MQRICQAPATGVAGANPAGSPGLVLASALHYERAMSTALVLVSTKPCPVIEDEGLPQPVVTPRRIRKAYTQPPYAPRPVVTVA